MQSGVRELLGGNRDVSHFDGAAGHTAIHIHGNVILFIVQLYR